MKQRRIFIVITLTLRYLITMKWAHLVTRVSVMKVCIEALRTEFMCICLDITLIWCEWKRMVWQLSLDTDVEKLLPLKHTFFQMRADKLWCHPPFALLPKSPARPKRINFGILLIFFIKCIICYNLGCIILILLSQGWWSIEHWVNI